MTRPQATTSERALVTGAGGFIGRHLVDLLVARGWTVRALLLPGEDAAALEAHGPRVEVRRGDVTNARSLEGIADDVGLVFHLAARVTDWGPVAAFRRVTIDGTRNLLEACRGRDVERFVYFSSFTALGFSRDTVGLDEGAACVLTGIPYSDTKVEAEALVNRLSGELGVPSTIVRPSNVIGPGSVFATDILDALREGRMLLIANGRMPTAFVHVRNLAEGALAAATSDVARDRTYHFRDVERVTWAEYIHRLGEWVGARPRGAVSTRTATVLGAALERVMTPLGRRPPVTRLAAAIIGRDHEVSVRRAQEELGWKGSVSLHEAMRELRNWTDSVYLPSRRRRSKRRWAVSTRV